MQTNHLALACLCACTTCSISNSWSAAGHPIVEELIVIAHPLSSEGLAQPSSVLEGDRLQRAAAATLGETLVNQPGVHNSSFGQAVGRPVIHGLGGPRVRIMEDRIDAMDVSVSSPDHATTIEPFMADRIEILKGPSTLLYGNGAIGGVVDVHTGRIPHEVPDRLSARAELRGADNADLTTAAGRLETGAGRFALHLDGAWREADDYEIPGFARSAARRALEPEENEARDILPGSDLTITSGALGASYVGARGFVGAAVSSYESTYGLPGSHAHDDGTDGQPIESPSHRPFIDLEQTRVDLEAAALHPLTGLDSLNFRLGWNDYEHAEIESDGAAGTTFENQGLEARFEAVHQPLGEVSGAAGIQLATREYAASGEEAFVPPVDTGSFGLFYVAERSFTAIDLEAGVRYERISHDPEQGADRTFDLIAGSIGLIAPFDAGITLMGQLDYSTRAPSVQELYADGPHLATRSFEIGDPDLDTERATNLSVTAQYEDDRWLLGASAYYTDFRDFIYERATGSVQDELPVYRWSQADASFYGIDLEAQLRIGRWNDTELNARAFYDRVRARLAEGDEENLPRIPPQRYGVGLQLEWRGLTATLDYARSTSQDDVAVFELPTPGFNDLRAYLGLKIPLERSSFELFITGRNLTDDEQRHHTSFIKDLAPQPGRTLEGGLRILL
jgi:iron complex outermembrane receptor protein